MDLIAKTQLAKWGHLCPVVVIAAVSVVLWNGFSGRACAQEDEVVIETEIGFDQFRYDQPRDDIKPVVEYDRYKDQDLEISEKQLIKLNAALRNVILENKKLLDRTNNLDRELRNLRGQRSIEVNRLNALTVERDAYEKQNEQFLEANRRFQREVNEMRAQLQAQDQELNIQVKELEEQLAKKEEEFNDLQANPEALRVQQAAVMDQKVSVDVLEMIERIEKENKKLKEDEGKIHYNMGNHYFNNAHYAKAAEEYKKAVELMPEDPSAHFNLAFVSGEYLSQHRLAVTHYKQYLQLFPQADDAMLVNEKIVESELMIRSRIASPLEDDLKKAREVLNR